MRRSRTQVQSLIIAGLSPCWLVAMTPTPMVRRLPHTEVHTRLLNDHAANGTVRGRVVVEGTNAPVGSAQVQLGTRGAQTNDAGVFSFASVPAGTYSLQIRMLGFAR